ncbi:MAG: OmpH family outer membrane protein [Paludibacteraceae bacterium]|nr:OmpH family outer membrane protein [Paludibacteraceae bacterium]
MKKIIIAMLLMMPMAISAQKFGHVNTQEIIALMPEVARMRLQMDTIYNQYESQMTMMSEEFQRKYQDYLAQEATMADAIKQIRQQELQEMQQRIQLFSQTAEQDVQRKQQELFTPIHEKLMNAIKAVGEREGYTYIFDTTPTSTSVVYIGTDATDVMPAVKRELGIQ